MSKLKNGSITAVGDLVSNLEAVSFVVLLFGQPVESGVSTLLSKSADCQSEAMLEYRNNVVILKDSQKNLGECQASFEANLMSMSWSDVTVFPCCSFCVNCSSASINFVII